MGSIDFSVSAPECAEALLGCTLIVEDSLGVRGGVITETEAYTQDDPASHSYAGMTNRNLAMFMEAGTIYIYQIYGKHYCFNIVCGKKDGQAVLIRALHPTIGIPIMEFLRKNKHPLSDGPAKLVVALGIEKNLNTQSLDSSTITIIPPNIREGHVMRLKRIGISKAKHKRWRFVLKLNQ